MQLIPCVCDHIAIDGIIPIGIIEINLSQHGSCNGELVQVCRLVIWDRGGIGPSILILFPRHVDICILYIDNTHASIETYGQIPAMDIRNFQIMEIRMAVIHIIARYPIQNSPHGRAFGGRNVPDLGFPSDHKGDIFALVRIENVYQSQGIHQSKG